MRVAYLVDRYVQPSQTFVVAEIEELRRQGVDIDVVSVRPGEAGAPAGTLVMTALDASWIDVARAHLAWILRRPRGYVRFRRGVRTLRSEVWPHGRALPVQRLPLVAEVLRARGVDRMHAHFAWGGAAAALLLSRLTGWPWAMTVHANDMFAGASNLDVKLAEATALVTVCEYNLDVLRREYGVRRPVTVLPCGVRTVESAVAPTPVYDVVAVGRLVPKKGFDLLVDAVALLRDDRPDLRVAVVGGGELEHELRARVTARGVERNVELLGPRGHDETLELIARSRLLCLPARVAPDGDRDSMPLVVKEALARGVPAVVTDVVAMREMVDDAVGRVVAPEDPAALRVALSELLGLGADGVRDMTACARQRVEERFRIDHLVTRLRSEVLGPLTVPRP